MKRLWRNLRSNFEIDQCQINKKIQPSGLNSCGDGHEHGLIIMF
jgi:hypothetical protein